MRDTKDTSANSAPEPITAESIVEKINEWGAIPIGEDLHELMCAFLSRKKYAKKYKECVFYSYRILSDALLQMEQYRKERLLLKHVPNQENERAERKLPC